MRILILTGKFGMGHWSASLSLQQQLLSLLPDAQVKVEDFFAYALSNSQAAYKTFQFIVTRGTGLYNAYYRRTENGKAGTIPVYALPLLDKMDELIARRQPDMVIATHPTCAQLLSRCKEERGITVPLVTCITDVTAHSEWIMPQCDNYLVPTTEVGRALVSKGVPRESVLITGIPVRQEFKLPVRRPHSKERRLLIMGGGLGLLPKSNSFYEELNALPGVHTTIITGSNQKLFHRLVGRYSNIQVLGYTSRVYDYMASSHMMLSKLGGITLFEAIFSQLPVLAWEPALEQERRNADFLLRRKIGRISSTEPEACLKSISRLIYDTDTLEDMSARMAALQEELADQSLARLTDLLHVQKGVAS